MRSIKLPSWSKRLLGLDPLPVPPHVFAVDARTARYGRFEPAGPVLDFVQYHWAELAPETFSPGPLGGPVRDSEALRQGLQGLLAETGAEVSGASLVLPDAWMRLMFAELDELPSSNGGLDEVLRWKLNKLVPFRVEELRLSSTRVAANPSSNGRYRFLLAFAFDQVLAQIEDLFASLGIRLGQISNQSVSLNAAMHHVLGEVEIGAFAQVVEGGYSLVCTRRGEAAFYRYKALAGGAAAVPWDLVARDLRLTRGFVGEQLGVGGPERLLLVCPEAQAGDWHRCLQEAFEVPVVAITNAHLRLKDRVPPEALAEVAPLVGAACQEVS